MDWTGWFAIHAGAASWAFDDVAIWMLPSSLSISGLVAEYIVAIDVTRVRFPADALLRTLTVPQLQIQGP